MVETWNCSRENPWENIWERPQEWRIMEVFMGNSMENTRASRINGDVNGEIWEKQLKIEVLMGTSYENLRPSRINEIFIRKCSHKNVHLFLKIHRGFSSKPLRMTLFGFA